ncbi:MAG: virulence RhuM family protein [Pseudomonadota bacterium]
MSKSKKTDKANKKPRHEIIIYESGDGMPHLSVRLENETVWLTQAQMVDLFQSSKANVSEHIKHILEEGELKKNSVVRNFRTTASDGKNYDIEHYNLDMIISLGYRIKSSIATRFRQWATVRLREYIVKGFTMDDERLKKMGGGGYWKELLARIRDIRSSEKVFYRQILDIYATSIDYDPSSDTSMEFFKKVQNKVHYAVHHHTAAEIIYNRADAEKEFMGLTTFQGTRPHLMDAVIAKNYLSEKELRALGQIVSGYLDFAERQAEREVPMKMADWADHLDTILTATGEKLLLDSGTISHEKAVEKAKEEYKKYQAKTLSEVEQAYLDTIKTVQKKVEKKVKE